jgi:hypothetical protein
LKRKQVRKFDRGVRWLKDNPIINKVLERVKGQQEKGLRKYGTYVKKKDYSLTGWAEHALQEQTDNLIYLQAQQETINEIKDEIFEIAALVNLGVRKEAFNRLRSLHDRL